MESEERQGRPQKVRILTLVHVGLEVLGDRSQLRDVPPGQFVPPSGRPVEALEEEVQPPRGVPPQYVLLPVRQVRRPSHPGGSVTGGSRKWTGGY